MLIFAAFAVILLISMLCYARGEVDARIEFRKNNPEVAEMFDKIFKS